jgi:2-hydroxy-6-oxonona-2,4-dienedioate hydrolase
MQYSIKQLDKFKYIEEGEGESRGLFNGFFCARSNNKYII